MQRRLLSFIAVPALAFGLAACGSSSKSSTASGGATTTPAAATSSDAQITISAAFTFATTPVKAGSTVTVKNNSTAQHTVTADAGGFDVKIDGGKTATFTAPAAGTYKFHCDIHNFMKGTLTVS